MSPATASSHRRRRSAVKEKGSRKRRRVKKSTSHRSEHNRVRSRTRGQLARRSSTLKRQHVAPQPDGDLIDSPPANALPSAHEPSNPSQADIANLSTEPAVIQVEPKIESEKVYRKAYMKGKYDGGEALLSQLIPEHLILPDISLDHIISLGFEQVKHLLLPLTDPFVIFVEMKQALLEGRPLSVVRLGDGELLALAHDRLISSQEIRKYSPFVATSGMTVPDYAGREALAESVRKATYVGVPISRLPYFQGLLYPVCREYGLSLQHMRITYSTVNYLIAQLGYLQQLLQGRNVLLIGNAAQELGRVLSKRGVIISGMIASVSGMKDIPRVMREAASIPFEIALVSAGIPAVIIAERIASELGKVALDFGHLANRLAEGEMSF
ncbi:GT-D fold domain-containing glycosyltransferase [Paenibacillus sp. SC116]|uniref:GT-D fold domain-containing protein n=1 Tax=Paenibacillus sp. SC116 TaxID=2968986 RepID=UPI00215A717E|nr:GT-D fold domain-containing glycosyltransferase [Paenibacillus sp. SC116]MCR8846162.1 GT-D fold domain-containing glycosyltransferase [Paenibacillus sp. SC116]